MLLKSKLFLIPALFVSIRAFADFDSVQNCIDQKYRALKHHRGIALAVVGENDTKLTVYGQAKLDQIFEIGSITKTFTGNLLAQEVGAGKLKLSDAIPREYQKLNDSPITYQHLTTHTSGIIPGIFADFHGANPESPYEGLSISIFKDLYSKTPLMKDAVPGGQYQYSNIAVGLLGTIIAEKNNTTYQQLVVDKIFKQLGMNDSYFKVPETEMHRFPKGNINGQPWSHWDLFDTAIDPAGGIRSTISDMALYARANLIPASTQLKNAITLSHKQLYYIIDKKRWIGMNWVLEPEAKLVWHNGWTGPFHSILAISSKYNLAVVALTDTDLSSTEVDDYSIQEVVFACLQ